MKYTFEAKITKTVRFQVEAESEEEAINIVRNATSVSDIDRYGEEIDCIYKDKLVSAEQ